MSRPKPRGVDEPFEVLDQMDFDPVSSAKKMPVDITNGMKPLSDYSDIRCDRIMPFRGKHDSDFKEWPEDKFALLVESIRANGVIEPITVRFVEGEDQRFELLAGEHRWKACVRLGLKTIPAHVMRDCDDSMAEAIFALTNILRRDNTIIDKVNGWWHYLKIIYYKREAQINQLEAEGVFGFNLASEAKAVGKRTIFRYAKMHDLIDEFLTLLDQNKLGIKAGEQIASLTPEQQTELIPYKDSINNVKIASRLHSLVEGKIDGLSWSKEAIESIIYGQPVTRPQKDMKSRLNQIIHEMIPSEMQEQADEIIKKALQQYFSSHPVD